LAPCAGALESEALLMPNDLRLSLAPTGPAPVTAPTITSDQLALIKQTIAKDATALELELFFYDCARRGVHPLDKLIHFTKRGGKYTPVTSIDFMRSRAAATGEYAGQDDVEFSGTPMSGDFAAAVRVYKFVQAQRCAFTATARWSEYKPDQDFMWRKMPHTMLGKCAEALALRKGFPQELSGLYEAAELDQASRQSVDQDTGEIVDASPRLITDAQRKRLFAIAKKAGWTKDAMKQALKARCAVESTQAIPVAQYDDICAMFAESAPMADPNETPF
jgi:phage recombination protein Bet